MRYRALATDFDGTIAHDGHVDDTTVEALRRVRAAGHPLMMVTGRELPSLFNTFAYVEIFARIVAENGAVVYDPALKEVDVLAAAPPGPLLEALLCQQIPISVGHCIVATVEPHEHAVLTAIHDLGLEWHVIFNKGSVMALPADVTGSLRTVGRSTFTKCEPLSHYCVAPLSERKNASIWRRSRALSSELEPLRAQSDGGPQDSLLESELFGHVRGSFTGAYRDKRGWLETANGGTIFMDEVGEMSLRMQAMLLRFLETGEIQRVGSDSRMAPLNVRVITATHRRLLDAIAAKDFREDLYYRLNVVHIEVPALRERREDVPLLIGHFLRTFSDAHRRPIAEISAEAMAYLTDYNWPGNVRELKNITERLVLKGSRTGRIEVDMLPVEVTCARQKVEALKPAGPAEVSLHEELFARLLQGTETFWSGVYEPFMTRDLTRRTVREIVRLGLEHTRGNYKLLVTTFNMPPDDYKKFLNFLQKYQCHVPFQGFRMMRAGRPAVSETKEAATA